MTHQETVKNLKSIQIFANNGNRSPESLVHHLADVMLAQQEQIALLRQQVQVLEAVTKTTTFPAAPTT